MEESDMADANGNIEEYNHYHPYGALMGESSASTQPYKYNGKELNRLLWYDQSARQYNPILGRFMSMDPLCEKYYSISPYAFCANNPIRFMDPDGRTIRITGEYQQEAIEQINSFVSKGVVIALDNDRKVSATVEDGAKLDKAKKKLLDVINNENIIVNLETVGDETRQEITGGAFMGNEVKKDAQGLTYAEAYQSVNPTQLSAADTYMKRKGTAMAHEITESYIGAKLAMEKGVGSREKGIKNPFYKKAHEKAINQPVLYSSFITDEYKRVQ